MDLCWVILLIIIDHYYSRVKKFYLQKVKVFKIQVNERYKDECTISRYLVLRL